MFKILIFFSKFLNEYKKLDLSEIHSKDIKQIKGITFEDCENVEIFYIGAIWNLSSRLSLGYRVPATASIYFKKFYLSYNFVDLEPALLSVTCVNLAAKIEESPIKVENLLACMKNLKHQLI